MEDLDDWLEKEITQELEKISLEDLEEETDHGTHHVEDLHRNEPPPVVVKEISCLNNYLKLRNNQVRELNDELQDTKVILGGDECTDLIDEENVCLPGTYSPHFSSSIELVSDVDFMMKLKEEEMKQEEDIAAEIKAHEMSLLALIAERTKLEAQQRQHEQQRKLEEQRLKTEAAVVVQAYWRGYRTRCQVQQKRYAQKLRQCRAAGLIQFYWRHYLQRRSAAASKIQLFWCHYRQRTTARTLLEDKRKREERQKQEKEMKHKDIEKKQLLQREVEDKKKVTFENSRRKRSVWTGSQSSTLSNMDLIKQLDLLDSVGQGSVTSYGNQPVINEGSVTSYGNQPVINEGSVTSYGNQPVINEGSVTSYGNQPVINEGSTTSYGNQPVINEGSTTSYGNQPVINEGSTTSPGNQPAITEGSSTSYGNQPVINEGSTTSPGTHLVLNEEPIVSTCTSSNNKGCSIVLDKVVRQKIQESCDLTTRSYDQPTKSSTESHDKNTITELAQMAALKEKRLEEELTAQLSRERMNQMLSPDQIAEVAKATREGAEYKMRLEYAASPLSPHAWMGVVEERRKMWQKERQKNTQHRFSHSSSVHTPYIATTTSKELKPLSDAQLLSASPQGTTIDQVTVVYIYGSRGGSVDLTNLSRCPSLRSLSLTKCSLTTFNEVGGANPYLQEVTLMSNIMEYINCSQMLSLRFLDISDNRLPSLHGLDSCKQLLELTVDENRIARIGGLNGCGLLQRLSVNSNLVINSSGVACLPHLQYLSLAENHLPKVAGLEACPFLQIVGLQQNNLQECLQLSNHVLLRELDLCGNSLSDISSLERAWLPSLQTLNISNNCISYIESLTSCIMLSTLDMNHNTLYDLPGFLQSIKGCFELKNLSIRGNPITLEPKFKNHLLKALPGLKVLDGEDIKHRKAFKVSKDITSHPIFSLVRRQIKEQDDMKMKHNENLESLSGGDCSSCSPEVAAKLLDMKIVHCSEYHNLLEYHLEEQHYFDGSCIIPLAERIRSRQTHGAIVIQRYWRGQKERRHYQKLKTAATIIQAVWRGYHTRQLYRTLSEEQRKQLRTENDKRVKAAITIQSYFRGYHLRQKLQKILDSSCFLEKEELEDEIVFDESFLLTDDVKPLSPTEDEIDRFILSSPKSPPPIKTIDHNTLRETPPLIKPMVPTFTLPGAIEQEIPLEEFLAEHEPHVTKATKPKTRQLDDIVDEWGFVNQSTAELMMKRAERHKKLRRESQKRIRLSDPSERLATFRRSQGHNVPVKPVSSESKTDSAFQWVHHKRVIHRQFLSSNKTQTLTTPTGLSEGMLPQLEPHVLAGHSPRLMTSRAQNDLLKQQTSIKNKFYISQAWN